MEKKPLVSVIMPVYNGVKTIKMALNSLINQTYQNWICIIVNDGSTDDTKVILDSLNDIRFRIIHLKKNVGRGAARQVALEHAEGDYLAYLDADDFYHNEKLEKQISVLENNNDLYLVGTRAFAFSSSYQPITTRGSQNAKPIYFKYGENLKLVMATAMARLTEAKKFKYNSKMNASEDYDYFSSYLDKKYYCNLNEVLLYFSVTESTTYRKILEYTSYEFMRGKIMLGKNFQAAMRVMITSSVKLIIYACVIPFSGTSFFLNRRGSEPSVDEISTFENQKNVLLKI